MAEYREHRVTLLSTTGREQPVLMRIGNGVSLVSPENQKDVNTFAFEAIRKWLPSNLRSRNPGDEDCLDLQIETDKGARELRMRCDGKDAVNQIIENLRETVLAIMKDADARQTSTESLNQRSGIGRGGSRLPPPIPPDFPPLSHGSDPSTVASADRLPSAAASQPQRHPVNPKTLPSTTAATGPRAGLAKPKSAEGPTERLLTEPLTKTAWALAEEIIPYTAPEAGTGGGSGSLAQSGAAAAAPQAQAHTVDVVRASSGALPVQFVSSMQHMGSMQGMGSMPGMGMGSPGGVHPPVQIIVNTCASPPAPALDLGSQGRGVAAHDEFQVAPSTQSFGPNFMNAGFLSGITGLGARSGSGILGAAVSAETSAKLKRADAQVTSLHAQVEELSQQTSFLENMVKRLSLELANKQGSVEGNIETETELLVDDGAPLPVWLKDRRYLNPLLAAYDDKISDLEDNGAQHTAATNSLQQQVEEVVSENERLRSDLSRALESRAMVAVMAENAAGKGIGAAGNVAAALVREEADLLRQENDLLVEQQSQLDGEIHRLRAQLEQQTAAMVGAAQEQALAMARAQQQASYTQAAESQHNKLHASLRAAEGRTLTLTQEVATIRSQLEDERISAETATRTLVNLQAMQGSIESESANNAQRARVATDAHTSLQVELSALRERYDAVVAEAVGSRREVEGVRGALSSLESKIGEYQRRDAEMYSRIREAGEVAEQARLARDSSLARQTELESQLGDLQARLASVRQMVRDQVYSELQATLHTLRTDLTTAKEELRVAHNQVDEYRSAAERGAREVASLASEMTALKEDLGETLSSKSKVTLMSLSTMERIQEVERQRDEATQRLETCARQLERQQRDWALEKLSIEHEMRKLRKSVVELEAESTTVRSEAAGHARHVDSLCVELASLRDARMRGEIELRQQVQAARAERDAEIKSMAARLEGGLAACARSVSEAERMLEAKEGLLARWKEEATLVASKLERGLLDHQRELEAREKATAEVRSHAEALHAAHGVAVAELEDLRHALPEMQAAMEQCDSRAAQMHMQLLTGQSREEELQQELRSVQAQLERAQFESKRSDRSRDILAAKYNALRSGDTIVGVQAILTGALPKFA